MLIAAIVLASLVLLALVASLVIYLITFYSPHKKQNDVLNVLSGEQYDEKRPMMRAMVENFAKMPFEEVHIVSHDGIKLFARYYHVNDGAPLAIFFHGYRGVGVRDCCGGGPLLIENGINVLVVDQRAHGSSGGHTITFGVMERLDCLDWCNYAVGRFGSDVQIALYGISMGAATVLMASELDLPANVRCITADCPYISPKEIVCKVCKDMKVHVKLAYPFIWLGAAIFGHFNLSKGNAAYAVRNAKIPILIIHGEDDRLVPCEMSQRIQSANPNSVRLETFPDAAHGISFLTDFPRYKRVALGFWNGVLRGEEN